MPTRAGEKKDGFAEWKELPSQEGYIRGSHTTNEVSPDQIILAARSSVIDVLISNSFDCQPRMRRPWKFCEGLGLKNLRTSTSSHQLGVPRQNSAQDLAVGNVKYGGGISLPVLELII